jgi:hypothetical protein
MPLHHAAPVPPHHQHEVHDHSHAPNMTDVQDVVEVPDTADDMHSGLFCHSVGCCTGLAALDVWAPTASYIPLGTLDVAVPAALVSAFLDPADPPPRLQT